MKYIQNETAPQISHEAISQRARELWESYGRPEGRDNEIWLEAERQLLGVDPKVESAGEGSVSAEDFDESTGSGKQRTRLTKSVTAPKTNRSSAKPRTSLKTAASDKPAAPSRGRR